MCPERGGLCKIGVVTMVSEYYCIPENNNFRLNYSTKEYFIKSDCTFSISILKWTLHELTFVCEVCKYQKFIELHIIIFMTYDKTLYPFWSSLTILGNLSISVIPVIRSSRIYRPIWLFRPFWPISYSVQFWQLSSICNFCHFVLCINTQPGYRSK